MKLHQNPRSSAYIVTAYGDGYLQVGDTRFEHAFALSPDTLIEGWGSRGFNALETEDFAALAALKPDLVLLGSGPVQRFPAPILLRPLIEARIGWEVMDTLAACRTYNILVAEGRKVAAGLLFG